MEMEGAYPDITFRCDEYGNVKGGVRTPYLDVPAYYFDFQSEATRLDEKTLKALYPTHDDYVDKVTRSAQKCVEERTLLQKDAEKIIAEAKATNIPC